MMSHTQSFLSDFIPLFLGTSLMHSHVRMCLPSEIRPDGVRSEWYSHVCVYLNGLSDKIEGIHVNT
jgi:hypothetical protein